MNLYFAKNELHNAILTILLQLLQVGRRIARTGKGGRALKVRVGRAESGQCPFILRKTSFKTQFLFICRRSGGVLQGQEKAVARSKYEEDVLNKGNEPLFREKTNLKTRFLPFCYNCCRSGGVLQGQENEVARSKYEEDVLTHNHVDIWGSFFDRTTMRWGYADDHSTLRNSYSTGAAGRRAREMAAAALKVERYRYRYRSIYIYIHIYIYVFYIYIYIYIYVCVCMYI